MNRGAYRATPHPIAIALGIVLVAGLVFVGISVYEPVAGFIMSLGERITPQLPEEEEPEDIIVTAPPAEPEPEPEQSKPEPAGEIRAAYMPFSSAGDNASIKTFLGILPNSVNGVMIDVKDSQGRLLYRSSNENAIAWGAASEQVVDLAALAETLNAEGYHLVARMHTFSDPICARGDRERNAIKYGDSEMLWLDNFQDQGGKPWSNPYAPTVRGYLTDIAAELAGKGAAMVVLDGMRFPDDNTGTAFFGSAAARQSRAEILKEFVSQVEGALEPLGVRVAVNVPATAVGHVFRDARYGGSPLELAGEVVLSILPEELAEGYLAEGVIVTRPGTDLGAMVSETYAYAKSQNGSVRIIPLLRGQMSGELALTKEQMDAQLSAIGGRDVGEYILYSQSGAYGS